MFTQISMAGYSVSDLIAAPVFVLILETGKEDLVKVGLELGTFANVAWYPTAPLPQIDRGIVFAYLKDT